MRLRKPSKLRSRHELLSGDGGLPLRRHGHVTSSVRIYGSCTVFGAAAAIWLSAAALKDNHVGLLRRELDFDAAHVTVVSETLEEESAEDEEEESAESQSEARAEVRSMLGLSRVPCAARLLEAGQRDTSDQEILAECSTQLSMDACEYALEILGDRPWGMWKADLACAALGEPSASDLRGLAQARLLMDRRSQQKVEPSLIEGEVWHSTFFDRAMIPKASLVKPRSWCSYPNVSHGKPNTLMDCVDRVKRSGAKYFLYGRLDGNEKRKCIQVSPKSRDCFDAVNTSEDFDLYSVNELEWKGSCSRPEGFCKASDGSYGGKYSIRDCDGDLIPDPVCEGSDPGTMNVLGSAGVSKCQETWPSGVCDARSIRHVKTQKCMEVHGKGGSETVVINDCVDGDEKQLFYYNGDFIVSKAVQWSCLSGFANRLTFKPCMPQEQSLQWFFDAKRHFKPRPGDKCAGVKSSNSVALVDKCDDSSSVQWHWSPVHDCAWSEWSTWGVCSTTCGAGKQRRYRFIAREAEEGGKKCEGVFDEVRTCTPALACPVNGEWDVWEPWGSCTATCGGGEMERKRKPKTFPAFGGAPLEGPSKEIGECMTLACPGDCLWAPWGRFGSCDRPCGGGRRYRDRKILEHARAGGAPCPCCSRESEECNTHDCPTDCEWAGWGEWSRCPRTCGGSKTQRSRNIKTQAYGGGMACLGDAFEALACGMIPCPIDCSWESWQDWSDCTGTCGYKSNTKVRSRGKNGPFHGGLPCSGSNQEKAICNSRYCPVDCVFKEWSEWSVCFRAMRKGQRRCIKRRTRYLKTDVENGGITCKGSDVQSVICPKCGKAKSKLGAMVSNVAGKTGEALVDAVGLNEAFESYADGSWTSLPPELALLAALALIFTCCQCYYFSRRATERGCSRAEDG